MKTTTGNCEECFISSRPATQAVWRVVRTLRADRVKIDEKIAAVEKVVELFA